MPDALYGLSIWEIAVIGIGVLSLVFLALLIRAQRKVNLLSQEVHVFEEEYKRKIYAAEEHLMEQQEKLAKEKRHAIKEKEKELDEKREKFVESLKELKEENRREVEKMEEEYRKKTQELLERKEEEKEEIREEKEKILEELEEYLKDLRQKAQKEIAKMHDKYEKAIELLQEENAKVIDQMNRMAILQKQSKPLPQRKERERFNPEDDYRKRLALNADEINHLRSQVKTLEQKREQDLAKAQEEIEDLRKKLKFLDLRG